MRLTGCEKTVKMRPLDDPPSDNIDESEICLVRIIFAIPDPTRFKSFACFNPRAVVVSTLT